MNHLEMLADSAYNRIDILRAMNQGTWEFEALTRNISRPLLDRVLHRNTVTAEQVMLEEADEVDIAFDNGADIGEFIANRDAQFVIRALENLTAKR